MRSDSYLFFPPQPPPLMRLEGFLPQRLLEAVLESAATFRGLGGQVFPAANKGFL